MDGRRRPHGAAGLVRRGRGDAVRSAAAERRRGLMRTRIIGVAVLAAVVATVLFAVPLGAGAFEYLMQHERVHLVGHARDVALSVAGDVHDSAPIDLEDVEDLVGEDHRVTIYDGNGDRLAGSGPDAPANVVSDALDGDVEADTVGDLFVAAVPVTYSDEVI